MKKLFTFFLFCLLSIPSFCTDYNEIQQLVLEAEKQWNAGNPDKSFLTAGNSIEYGLGYLKTNKFTESLWYFDEVIKKDASNSYARLFAGLANIGLQQFSVAEEHFSRLDGINIALQEKVKTLLQKARQEAAIKPATMPNETVKTPEKNTGPKNKKPAKEKKDRQPSAGTSKAGGSLVYGDYVFTLDYWDVSQRRMIHQQKGYFSLHANGTYQYMGATGKYNYNSATGAITWLSGTFQNMGKNKTSFTRNKTTCQIDFEYLTGTGKVYYSGGKNL